MLHHTDASKKGGRAKYSVAFKLPSSEEVSEKTETINSVSKAFVEESSLLKDGVYSGEGMGNNGTIAVEVTIEDRTG